MGAPFSFAFGLHREKTKQKGQNKNSAFCPTNSFRRIRTKTFTCVHLFCNGVWSNKCQETQKGFFSGRTGLTAD